MANDSSLTSAGGRSCSVAQDRHPAFGEPPDRATSPTPGRAQIISNLQLL